jgi:hypothetical protein
MDKKYYIPVIIFPGVSPDLSIMESMASILKRKFHLRRYTIQEAALAWFKRIFKEEIDQTIIQYMYNRYTKRLHDCIRAKGQMIKY